MLSGWSSAPAYCSSTAQHRTPRGHFKPFSTAHATAGRTRHTSSPSSAWHTLAVKGQSSPALVDRSSGSASQPPASGPSCSGRDVLNNTTCNGTSHSRRQILWEAVALSAAVSPLLPGLAQAAPGPSLSSVAPPGSGGLASRLTRALPFQLPITNPEPVKFPRKGLDQRFAVLLMRSSYDAVNVLDFIPMEKFEVRWV